MASVKELLERVRKATGPDRELDWRIADATDHPSFDKRFENMWPPFGPKSKLDRDIPAYTASIDAALALTERLLPGCKKSVTELVASWSASVLIVDSEHPAFVAEDFHADAATAPLAILAALLTSLSTKEG